MSTFGYIGRLRQEKYKNSFQFIYISDRFAVWKKTPRFVNHVFRAYLNHNLSDMYGAPFGKKYTFCEPCFLSLNKLKKHGSQNVDFFSKRRICPIYKSEISDLFCVCLLVRLRAQFVRYISRIFPMYISD